MQPKTQRMLTTEMPDSILPHMLTERQIEHLQRGAAELGVILDGPCVAKFARFASMLEEANRRLNLTRIPQEDIVPLHFLDSLTLASALTPRPGERLIDVGTGAGFPGLPIAIAYPQLDVTLVDGTGKRLEFVSSVIDELGISNAVTLHGRAEEIARLPQHRAGYHLVTARAVAKLPALVGWLLPLVRPGGRAIAYKGRNVEVEADDARSVLQRLGGELDRIVPVSLPGTDIERQLVILKKKEASARSRR